MLPCRDILRFVKGLRQCASPAAGSAVQKQRPGPPSFSPPSPLPMPIAFKEWAVTVRALAEGEQLVTLRKCGVREENKELELEHERFFLFPTFEHLRNDVVRASHQPELRRALEEGIWPDAEPPAHALTRDGGLPQPV